MTPDAIEALRRAAETPAKAGPADIAAVAEDLAAAFAQDPQFNWFMRDDAKRAAAQVGFFKMLLSGISLSHGAVTRPITSGAAAIWLASETLGPNSMLAELRALPTILAATGFRRLGRLLAMREAISRSPVVS